MIAAIYARKSTDQGDRADEDKSVARQQEHARAYAARKGWTVAPAHVYVDDGVSGGEFLKRRGFLALMNALKPRPPFQVLVVMDQSRLGRSLDEVPYAIKRITDAGVRIFCYLTDAEVKRASSADKFMVHAVAFVDDMHREQSRARTHDALARKAKAGHVTGGLTYGYANLRVDGHVERRINAVEAAVVRRIFELYAAGVGLRAIARLLTAEGAPPPMPRQRDRVPGWGPVALREILRRPLYRGELVWNRRQKVDRGGRTKVRIRRPDADLIRVTDERLRIVSNEFVGRGASPARRAGRGEAGGLLDAQPDRHAPGAALGPRPLCPLWVRPGAPDAGPRGPGDAATGPHVRLWPRQSRAAV
jgi:site-specific DNA recombinase